MVPQGYLHEKLDVKILILFILARVDRPLRWEELYELCYLDDSLNYFTFSECLPELLNTGHLRQDDQSRYSITEKGREHGAITEDSLAVPVVQKALEAISKMNAQIRRDTFISVSTKQDDKGCYHAVLTYTDGDMPLMELSLMAADECLAKKAAKNLDRHAEELYKFAFDMATSSEPLRRKKS